MNFLERLQPLGLLVLRLVLGAIMIAHGSTKVFGGMHAFTGVVSGLGIPWWLAYFAAAAEFGGGILVILGLLTRFVSLCILIDMLVAIVKVHWKHGFVGEGNYQFPLALAAIAFSLIFFGGGPIAIDWLWGSKGRR
ncbi:MAG: DoxX family protein [Candidatus Korobacteraceae bacterium]